MGRKNELLIPAGTPWLTDAGAQRVMNSIAAGGFDVYFVGGCVRNALLDRPVSDIDLSTNARPETVMALAEKAGIKAVPTGVGHGTVTLIVDGLPYEITTFRRDVETDGRRAVVAFSDEIADDARRRDFTMNAIYATRSGALVDPLNGLPDLYARRVRFIEDPVARIREDYLRILRYFRFNAWYGDAGAGYDPEALNAIASNLHGLETLSAERIGQEMKRLLAAPDPSAALAVMGQTGVLTTILPGASDRLAQILIHIEGALGIQPDWIVRLAALGGEDPTDRLRLSKAETRQLDVVRTVGFDGPALAEVAYRHGAGTGMAAMLLRAALAEAVPKCTELETIKVGAQARFPVQAADLMPDYKGAALGRRLAHLEQHWIDAGFALTREELLHLS